jgi:tetratricopeptide (TPR) repeat protein
MSQNELELQIASAVHKLRQVAAAGNSAAEKAVENLENSGWPPANFTAPEVRRFARLLREYGDERLEESDPKQLAEEVLSNALHVFPDDAELLNEQGRLCSDSKKYDLAVEWFRKTIEKNPKAASKLHLEALIGSGEALRNLRSFDEAAEMLRKALAEQGGTPSEALLVQQGWLCFYRKSYVDAYKRFEKAVDRLTGMEKRDARVGMLASCRQIDLLSSPHQHNARQLVSDWLIKAGESRNEVVTIFLECSESVLEHLNLYPAALKNAEHLLEIATEAEQDSTFEKTAALQKGVYFKIGALKWLRRYRQAERTYHDAPPEVRTCIKVWNEIANCYFEQKQFVEAHRHYSGEAVVDANLTDEQKTQLKEDLKTDADAREWTIVSLRKMRKFDVAREEVNKALSELKEKLPFVSESAALYYAERDYDNAIKLFKHALELNDYDTFALQWRAVSLRKNGDLAAAKKLINDGLRKVPFSTRLWNERGWSAYDQGNFEEANRAFDKAIELDPYLMYNQFAKVETLLHLNRSDDALEVFKKLEQQFPNDAEVTEQLCWFYIRIGELELAEEQQVRLRQRYPNSVLALNAQGGCELALKRYEVAERAFRGAIDQVDYEPQYYINLAFALIRQVRSSRQFSRLESPKEDQLIHEAKKNCRIALKLEPYDAKAYECLGIIAFKQDLVLDAEYYFRKSIEVNSKEEASYVQLGSLYCQRGSYDKATEMLNKALELNPKEARAYIELANVAAWKEENNEAIGYCREAVFVRPKDLETHRALAIALMRANRYEEAELVVRKALVALAPFKPWRLQLLLAQILVRIADTANKDRKKKDLDLYEEALRYVNQARRSHAPTGDILFHLGIVQYRLEDFVSSKKSFAGCLKLDREHYDAERNSRTVQTALDQQRKRLDVNEKFSYGLALVCLVMLVGLWLAYFQGHKRSVPIDSSIQAAAANSPSAKDEMTVNQTLLQMMTPLLLGLLTIAALLPNLSKLKLPGFEAEIAKPTSPDPSISTGPRGEIGFGSSLPVIDPEPR